MNWNITSDKINEIVRARFCYTALLENIITSKTLLIWLSRQSINDDNLTAYRCICIFSDTDDHYISGRHFTTIVPDIEYLLVYILSGGDEKTPAFTDANVGLVQERSMELAEIYRSQKRFTKIRVLCNLETSERFKYLSMVTHHHNKMFSVDHKDLPLYFKTLWIESIQQVIKPSDFKIFIKESLYLKDLSPWLWSTYLQSRFHDIASSLYTNHLPESISKHDLDQLSELYPGLIPEDIQKLSNTSFNIYIFNDIILKAYLLGFPIHYFTPNNDQIHKALIELTYLDIDDYILYMKKCQPLQISNSFHPHELSYSNEIDLLNNNINSYLPFDVFTYIDGDQIYRFTRPEFKRLIQTKKNHWSGSDLPDIAILELQTRLTISINHNFPIAAPWKIIIETISLYSSCRRQPDGLCPSTKNLSLPIDAHNSPSSHSLYNNSSCLIQPDEQSSSNNIIIQIPKSFDINNLIRSLSNLPH